MYGVLNAKNAWGCHTNSIDLHSAVTLFLVIETGPGASQGDASHSLVQLEGRGIKNLLYYNEVDGGSSTLPPHDQRRQPTEQYNTLVQVGGRSSSDHVQLSVLQDSTPTYAMLK